MKTPYLIILAPVTLMARLTFPLRYSFCSFFNKVIFAMGETSDSSLCPYQELSPRRKGPLWPSLFGFGAVDDAVSWSRPYPEKKQLSKWHWGLSVLEPTRDTMASLDLILCLRLTYRMWIYFHWSTFLGELGFLMTNRFLLGIFK